MPATLTAASRRAGGREVRKARGMVKVLVVDDELPIREVLREVCEEEGYAVDEATDGREALSLLERGDERYVVLLDLIMPRMDGLALLRHMAERPELASQHKYIVHTAQLSTSLPELARLVEQVGATMVEKPFDLTAVCEAVRLAERRLLAPLLPNGQASDDVVR